MMRCAIEKNRSLAVDFMKFLVIKTTLTFRVITWSTYNNSCSLLAFLMLIVLITVFLILSCRLKSSNWAWIGSLILVVVKYSYESQIVSSMYLLETTALFSTLALSNNI